MPTEEQKKESTLIGYVTICSGSLLLADGIAADRLPVSKDQRVVLDLERETGTVRYPILALTQGSDRFLVIPLDRAEPLPVIEGETVTVSDPVEIPEQVDEEEEEEVGDGGENPV